MLVSNINFQKQFYCRLYKENCTCRHDFGLVVGTETFLILHLFSVSYFTPVFYSFVFYRLLTYIIWQISFLCGGFDARKHCQTQ